MFVGPEAQLAHDVEVSSNATIVDAAGGAVVPGFIDPHTHLVFSGDRRQEIRRRLAGENYGDIAASGGGILSTVAATRASSEDELVASAMRRLDEMLRCGTTCCEVKSGYALTVEGELKMLRAIAALQRRHVVEITATFLGAHEVPPEYRTDPDGYVQLVVDSMIPAVVESGLAEWCDVFCERGVFSAAQSHQVLAAARAAGLKLRIHADEFASSGGSRIAAQLRVRAADHLIFVDREGAEALGAAGVTATVLPIAALYLKAGRFAPARLLIECQVPVALGTDLNPGAGLSPSMPFAMTLACFQMGLTFEEALIAATLNAAYAIDRHDRVGSLESGKQLDAVVVDGPAVDLVRVGVETVRTVVKHGTIVHARR